MKKAFSILTILLALSCGHLHAQQSEDSPAPNSDEVSNQDKTTVKYGLTAIAELQLYLGWLIKGYEIVRDGLNTIHQIKSGEFDLHNIFYTSLERVNPSIKGFSEIAAILANEDYVIGQARAYATSAEASNMLSAAARDALKSTSKTVLADCNRVLGELDDVTTPGRLKMTDDERLKRIHTLYAYSVAQKAFAQSYRQQVATYLGQRIKDLSEQQWLKEMYLK
ncbi:hypothetical protein PV783_13810 [Chitinophaga sp. CC14]|uniref:hypothetical protein n=1 Tax=Chitinophaga sp. CC14 TaxID=3029199 RepID=UPI003B7BE269